MTSLKVLKIEYFKLSNLFLYQYFDAMYRSTCESVDNADKYETL